MGWDESGEAGVERRGVDGSGLERYIYLEC